MSMTSPIAVPSAPAETPFIVAAFYRFVRLNDFEAVRPILQTHCRRAGVLGTILLAPEGINGTVCGSQTALEALMQAFAADARLADITPKFSFASEANFHRMKVRLKKEIVSMGQPDIDPVGDVGAYVAPENWNQLISDPDTLVIDTRNAYEVAIGTFEGAIDPKTKSFRDFPEWVDGYLAKLDAAEKPKNIAMFCTGGIRCEKASAYMLAQGFENVYHLKGGILEYLETVNEEDSKWKGDCFVFDQRVAVGHGLKEGDWAVCHACREPLSAIEMARPEYENGVSCHHCKSTLTPEREKALRARQQHYAEKYAD